MCKFKIIKGKCHHVLYEIMDKNEYIIMCADDVLFWRPSLASIGSEYMTLLEVTQMIRKLESDTTKRWRSVQHKKDLLKFWEEILQLMRSYRIEKILTPDSDQNSYFMAC
jgi:hypothetical protein